MMRAQLTESHETSQTLKKSRHRHGLGFPGLVLIVAAVASSCITVVRTVEVEEIDPAAIPVTVVASTKAHLMDGSVLLMPTGFVQVGDSLVPSGISTLYNTQLESVPFERVVPIDDILALETFEQGSNGGATLLATAFGTAAAIGVGTLAAVAIFGSCPTVYSTGPEGGVLQAELFSNSIVSLFEMKDWDRLDVRPNGDGNIVLELRNEALETHYINQLELLEIPHSQGEAAYPIGAGEVIVVSNEVAPTEVFDMEMQSHSSVLTANDSLWYATSSSRLDALVPEDLSDHIDLTWPSPATESAALVLRARNSLLNTIFLYDVMIASQGAASLDWMHTDLNSIDMALEMGDFFQKHMGIRVSVLGDDGYVSVGRLGNVGPIAWEDVAMEIPVLQQDSMRVRLEFLADGWRIDRAALGDVVSTAFPTPLPVNRVENSLMVQDDTALEQITDSDESYLVTGPGTTYQVTFDSILPIAQARTYVLAAQGYYTEWVRGTWIKNNPVPKALTLNDETLLNVIHRWRERKADFENQFYETKIRVR